MIDHLTIQKILDSAQIVEVIQEFVSLKRRGVNFIGLCPFHNEKTPSFTVSPSKGIFKCFGCGKGGNVVNFIMEHEHLSYPEALKYLAKKYDIEIEESQSSEEDIEKKNERDSMLVLTTYAGRQFHENLFNSDEGITVGLSYFKERGFRQATLKKFEIGYSFAQHDAFSKKAISDGYDEEYLIKTGLSVRRDERLFDRFNGRVIFPIHSLAGQILGFGGRILKTDPKAAKYINSPESDIYHKSRIVYGIFQARKSITKEDKCYLVEGYTDVLSLHEAGIENVVASSGTSLTQEQVRLIKRFTRNITIIYDGDEAGIKASLRGIDIVLEEGMNVKIVLLPEGEDPDSYSKKISNEEFLQFIRDHETDFIRFKTKLLLADAKNDPVKRAGLLHDIVSSIAVIPEIIIRTVYIKECSTLMEIPETVIYNEVNKLRRQKSFQERNRYPAPEDIPIPVAFPARQSQQFQTADSFPSEREIARLLLKYGSEVYKRIINKNDGTETIITVADYIVKEIMIDNLEFENPVFAGIFSDYKFHVDQGLFPGDQHFVKHPDPGISMASADLLADTYEISQIWKQKQAYVETETDKLKEIVEDAVLKFKADKIKSVCRAILKQIDQASKDGDMEKVMILQKKYDILSKTLSLISKKMGNRIIL
ncbi:MAG TPA: DNA primase [Bacteroidales bacterium]|nr:DNA primase [Bacteroidales bacterium]HOU95986.1 DNA primase [Bacteroidales bacterium]HQG36541.1 DNA primase [Bacteroidales bacterium]HQG53031.1 DNA primase [Bacteroidales bacterium]HQJ20653.1 DNA primase [Bacteroidales bacterium]